MHVVRGKRDTCRVRSEQRNRLGGATAPDSARSRKESGTTDQKDQTDKINTQRPSFGRSESSVTSVVPSFCDFCPLGVSVLKSEDMVCEGTLPPFRCFRLFRGSLQPLRQNVADDVAGFLFQPDAARDRQS